MQTVGGNAFRQAVRTAHLQNTYLPPATALPITIPTCLLPSLLSTLPLPLHGVWRAMLPTFFLSQDRPTIPITSPTAGHWEEEGRDREGRKEEDGAGPVASTSMQGRGGGGIPCPLL